MSVFLVVLLSVLLVIGAKSAEAQDLDAARKFYNQRDYQRALKEFLPLAHDGNAEAQVQLALMYEFGYGFETDYSEAAKWYKLAATQGVTLAQSNLGYMFQHGIGVPQDYIEAIQWYQLAVEQGHAPAMYGLGLFYETVMNDAKNAYMWYNLSIANGSYGLRERDALVKQMKIEDVLRAQLLSRQCLDGGYRECGE